MSDQFAMILWVSVAEAVAVVFTLGVIGAVDAADRRTAAAWDEQPREARLATWSRRAVRLVVYVAGLTVALMPGTAVVAWLLARG